MPGIAREVDFGRGSVERCREGEARSQKIATVDERGHKQ